MPEVVMSKFDYICGACEATFSAPVFLGGYGELVARSSSGNLAYVNTLEDPVFDEAEQLARSALDRVSERASAPLTGSVGPSAFAVACDPDPSGNNFVIGAHPPCPHCGSQEPSSWVATEELIRLEVPRATHTRWLALSPEARVDEVLRTVTAACSAWSPSPKRQ
jgi:hypothetical protein